jgi:hypothetical protein
MQNKKLVILAVLMVSAFVSGFVCQLVAPDAVVAPIDIVSMLVSVFLLFFWFRLDSDERGYRRSPLLNAGVVGLGIVVLPYYFFRSRGFAGGLGATAVFLVACAVYSLLQFSGIYLAYLTAQG